MTTMWHVTQLLLVAIVLAVTQCQFAEGGDGTHSLQYNLLGLTDVLASKLGSGGNPENASKVGDNAFRLITGDEYVVDPEAPGDPVLDIEVEDSNYIDVQAFYSYNKGLKLCSAIPDTVVTFDSLPIGGTPGTNGESPSTTRALHKLYKISVTHAQVKQHIFPILEADTKTRGAYKKMSICVMTRHPSQYDVADKSRTRPIPIFTILFKNANVLRKIYDSRNSKVCEKQKHRYINVDFVADLFDLNVGPRGQPGPTKTKTTTGMLRVFTPNQRVYTVEDVHSCRGQYFQIVFDCGRSAWEISKTWLPVLEHGVTAQECQKWKKEKKCRIFYSKEKDHTETLDLAQVSANQYRTNVTDNTINGIFRDTISNVVHKSCVNRKSGKLFVRNCILDTNVPSTYSFPFESTYGGGRVLTPYGHVKASVMATTVEKSATKDPLTGEPEYGYFTNPITSVEYGYAHVSKVDSPSATLVWPRSGNQLRHYALTGSKHVCPYTALLEIPVKSIITDALEHTDIALNRAGNNILKKVITFVENSPEDMTTPHRFKVYDNQKMSADDITRLGLNPAGGKCMHNPSSIYQTYLVDGTVLLQFVDKSQMVKTDRYVPRWNRNKLKYNVKDTKIFPTKGVNRNNVHHAGTSREISDQPTDLDEAVCSTTLTTYTDAYGHEWQCRHGVATLTKVATRFDAVVPTVRATNPTPPVLSKESSLHTGWFNPFSDIPVNADVKKLAAKVSAHFGRIHHQMQLDRLSKSAVTDLFGLLDPTLVSNIIFPDEDVKVTKAGDWWAVHRCKKVLWSNMRIVTSLRLNHPDMPIPTVYRNLATPGDRLNPNVHHLSEMCYASPIVKVLDDELGVSFMQVINGGKELSTELNMMTPCNRMNGRLHFNVGDQVVTFSGKTGDFHHAVERKTSPMSSLYNIFHTGKTDPLVRNTRTGGTHISTMFGGGTNINNNVLSTDEYYVPKPDESSQFTGYHSNVDGNVRDHLLEVGFRESMKPISPGKFLATVDAAAVNMFNLERYKRQERDNVPHHFWPYSTHTLGENIPNTPDASLEDDTKSALYKRHRVVQKPKSTPGTKKTPTMSSRTRRSTYYLQRDEPLSGGVHVGGRPGVTMNDQRRLPLQMGDSSSFVQFSVDSMRLHVASFMEEYGYILLIISVALSLILTPTVFFLISKLTAIDKYMQDNLMSKHGNANVDHSMTYARNAVLGNLGSQKLAKDREIYKTADRETKTLYRTDDAMY